LNGGAGNDTLQGDVGNEVFRGGTGDDTIADWGGDDRYHFAAGDGADAIFDIGLFVPSTADQLIFEGGIDPTELWLSRQGDDLLISRLGSTDSVLVGSWFANSIYQIETIAADDGTKALNAADVNSLISQMAAFSAQVGTDPSAIQASDLPPEYHLAVNSTWQST
jgi:Ca2+-binding RTX toxin-like protein